MQKDKPGESPHRRLNLLTGEYVLVSPNRTMRPWSGLEEPPDLSTLPEYDPNCYLCPGNTRSEGDVNPAYSSTFVFTNDYSALLPSVDDTSIVARDDLLIAEPERGICRVICYSPRHDLTIARMQPEVVTGIIETWQQEYLELGSRPEINYVQIFENRGLMMGCSNPHPHGQIWASESLPTIPAREAMQQELFMKSKGECLLCSYLDRELHEQDRILFVNQSFVALVPFWAVWPFETMIIPRSHSPSIESLSVRQKTDLAGMMVRLGVCYDNLFQTSFPYSMGIHQQPTDGKDHSHQHWHIHYLPPLLRSQSIRKHMVGFELLGMPQRDLTAEAAAKRLRGLSAVHYLEDV